MIRAVLLFQLFVPVDCTKVKRRKQQMVSLMAYINLFTNKEIAQKLLRIIENLWILCVMCYNIQKAVNLRIDCFFLTQKGVIDLCKRFGTRDNVLEPMTSILSIIFLQEHFCLYSWRFFCYRILNSSSVLTGRISTYQRTT